MSQGMFGSNAVTAPVEGFGTVAGGWGSGNISFGGGKPLQGVRHLSHNPRDREATIQGHEAAGRDSLVVSGAVLEALVQGAGDAVVTDMEVERLQTGAEVAGPPVVVGVMVTSRR